MCSNLPPVIITLNRPSNASIAAEGEFGALQEAVADAMSGMDEGHAAEASRQGTGELIPLYRAARRTDPVYQERLGVIAKETGGIHKPAPLKHEVACNLSS